MAEFILGVFFTLLAQIMILIFSVSGRVIYDLRKSDKSVVKNKIKEKVGK